MRYLHVTWAVLIAAIIVAPNSMIYSQGATATEGDPPIAAFISISPPDANGNVTITGAPGAVFPAAEVAVRNLYTEDVVYTIAGITGAFNATLFGPGNTPFHISPTRSIPADRRNQSGSLPGGPGTIIYGGFPETQRSTQLPITQLLTDGNLDDWGNYSGAAVDGGFVLQNQDAIYIAQQNSPAEFARVRVQLTTNASTFTIVVNPFGVETAVWAEESAAIRDLGTIAAVAAVSDGVEIRIPLAPIRTRLAGADVELSLAQLSYIDDNENVIDEVVFGQAAILQVEEESGIVYLNSVVGDSLTRFSVSGPLAQGASVWHARTRTQTLTLEPGDSLNLEMDVQLRIPDLPPTLTGLRLIGRFGLLPVNDDRGQPVSGGLNSNNGWSTVMTPGGLAIENIPANLVLGEVVVPAPQVIRKGEDLLAGMPVSLPIPDNLPAGTYVPYFEGYGQIGDGERFRWVDNGVFGAGEGVSPVQSTRLPIVLSIGTTQPEPKRLPWTLFNDEPSNGSRGLVAVEEQSQVSLSNRVKFNSPTYILQPSTRYDGEIVPYNIEPYIPNMLPNSFNTTTAPLLPLLFPNGRISATVERPSGGRDVLSSAPIVQNALSTTAVNESANFGQHTQVDTYRLTTLNDTYTAQLFDDYGEYTIEMSGFVEDVWGNRYEGGGTYNFLVAEMLDLSPAVLPGTPFEVGDHFDIGLHISPGVAADVTITMSVFPLDGSEVIQQTYEGTANPYGVFQADVPFTFDVPGEYIVDYDVRYNDADNRLWAGSLRSAGVIASTHNELVLRGNRGIANDDQPTEPAWFFVEKFTDVDSENASLFPPYHNGDVLWLANSPATSIISHFNLQDLSGRYADWLAATHPDYTSSDGVLLERLNTTDQLPNSMFAENAAIDGLLPFDQTLAQNEGYTYVNFVQPHVSVRQMVLGSELGDISLDWSPDDPLNQQIGAGSEGALPGDYVFMFGGAILRNSVANIQQSAIYGAFGSIISADADTGARITPPYAGAAAGPNGGALFNFNGQTVDMFFHPTGVRPGNVMEVGDVLSIAGQVAPTLASNVAVTVTSPSGDSRSFTGTANRIGYFYSPENDFAVDEIGVWTVQVTVSHTGRTSAGVVQPPFPTGDILGTENGTFSVYVVDTDSDKLEWTQIPQQDLSISPGFPFNITFNTPPGWTETNRYFTARFPSLVIEDGLVSQPGGAHTYQYNPTALSQQYPFFEGDDGRESGADSSDPLYLTFVFTGTNADGEFDIAARQVVIRHDRLLTLE